MSADVHQALARIRPASVRIIPPEGPPLTLTPPGRRNKWSALSRQLETVTYQRVELCDASGDVVRIFEGDAGPADTSENFKGGSPGSMPTEIFAAKVLLDSHVAAQQRLLETVVKMAEAAGQREAEMRRTVASLSDALTRLMDGYVANAEKASEALSSLALAEAEAEAAEGNADNEVEQVARGVIMSLVQNRMGGTDDKC